MAVSVASPQRSAVHEGARPAPQLVGALRRDAAGGAQRAVSWPAPAGRAVGGREPWPELPILLVGARTAHDPARQLTVVADVRLDEREELCRALGGCSTQLDDAELILRAYARWGMVAPERLRGAFAFALWDGAQSRLLCARDSFGLRLFHYWHAPDRFVFATYAEDVLDHAGIPREVDELTVAARLARHGGITRQRSAFRGVRKLPPGELLSVTPGHPPRHRAYWAPEDRPRLQLSRAEDYAEAVRDTLTRAVADAVRDDTPHGAHLSGGIDSTGVAVLAQRCLRERGRSLRSLYSWAPPPDGDPLAHDERPRVLAVAGQLGVPVTFTVAEAAHRELLHHWWREQVPTDTLLREVAVQRAAAEEGLRVLLSGWGGDELASFNGRGHLASLASHARWPTIARYLARSARRSGSGPRHVARAALSELNVGLLPLLPARVQLRLRAPQPGERPGEPALVTELRDDAFLQARDRRGARETQLALLRFGHLTARIEAWAQAGARLGLDYRYPLLDRRLVDLCLSLPEDLWLRAGFTRWVFRAAMAPLLPAELVWGAPKREPALLAAYRRR